MYSLRLASSSIGVGTGSGTGLGFALGRFRGGSAAASVSAPAAAGRIRPVSATPNPAAPVPGDQGVSMEQSRQQQPQPQPQPPPPRRDAAAAGEQQDETHETTAKGDVMSHSFGEGYSTRSDEEGFGGTYGGNDRVFNRSGGDVHPSHPDYDRSQGSEVKETEKARHLKDDKHAT